MLTPTDAARLILEHVRPLPAARVPLREAHDLVLAEDVTSPIDLPAWDNSAMDGYAIAGAGGGLRAGAEFRIVESVAAGQFPARPVGPGEATRIFTGAPLPAGADTVIRQEDTSAARAGRVTVTDARDAGKNIRRRGEDIRKGTVVLTTGTALAPAVIGVLASIAYAKPLVYRRARVAFLGSGDEIVDLDRRDEIIAGTKIATSNSYTVDALLRRDAATPVPLGIARDTKDSLREHLERTRDADLLITSAGISVGEHDFVREVLGDLGLDLKFWRIRMRPGAPVGFGLLAGMPWIGLPGNPVSTMVTYELFVRPALRRLQGHLLPYRRTVPVILEEPITLGPPLRHFLRGVVTEDPDGGPLRARLTGPQGSGILTSMARANALLIVPEDRRSVAAGERLLAIRLDDPQHVDAPPF